MQDVLLSDIDSNTNLYRKIMSQKFLMTEDNATPAIRRFEFNVKAINRAEKTDPAYGIAFEFRPITGSKMYGVYLIVYTETVSDEKTITNQISMYLENISYSELNEMGSTTFVFGDKVYDGTKRPLVTIEYGNFNQITLNELPFALHNMFGENTQRNVYVITQFHIQESVGASKK